MSPGCCCCGMACQPWLMLVPVYLATAASGRAETPWGWGCTILSPTCCPELYYCSPPFFLLTLLDLNPRLPFQPVPIASPCKFPGTIFLPSQSQFLLTFSSFCFLAPTYFLSFQLLSCPFSPSVLKSYCLGPAGGSEQETAALN